jgi:hypothetical protein
MHMAKKMVRLLSKKLTADEFSQLVDLIDEPPAGEFWQAMNEENQKLNPDLYCATAEEFSKEKMEIK